jgi:hypothetical protein
VAYRDLGGANRTALLAAARRRDDPAPAFEAFMRLLRTAVAREDWSAPR